MGSVRSATPAREVAKLRRYLEALESEAVERNTFSQLEAGFVAHAVAYSERHCISFAAWREVGVPADVLKRAGIGEGSAFRRKAAARPTNAVNGYSLAR